MLHDNTMQLKNIIMFVILRTSALIRVGGSLGGGTKTAVREKPEKASDDCF